VTGAAERERERGGEIKRRKRKKRSGRSGDDDTRLEFFDALASQRPAVLKKAEGIALE
jgi:hypothetical protein